MATPATQAHKPGGQLPVRVPREAPCGGPESPLSWGIGSHDRLVVITLAGELNAATTPRLAERITPIAETGTQLVLQLARVSFCGAAGLALFLDLHRRAVAAGGSLQLAAPSPRLARLIERTGLAGVLAIREGTPSTTTRHTPTPELADAQVVVAPRRVA